MDLYLLRHGKAEEYTAAKPDRDRCLVARGIADTTRVAHLLKTLEVAFDAIYTSPYPRAAQTARIVAETLDASDRLQECAELASGRFGMGSLQTLASGQKGSASLLFVGHEPDLSEIIAQLCGAVCEMKTAGLASLTLHRPEPGAGVLHWLLPPQLIRTRT